METLKKITLQGMIIWAKDRLVDDIKAFIEETPCFLTTINYCEMCTSQRKKFKKEMSRLIELLNLPETDIRSLKQLAKAGYFNGNKDTMWEWAEVPDWFKKKWAERS
jgi:hypothetical protein